MKKLHYFICLLFLSFSVCTFSQSSEKATGNWSGTIELPTAKLEIIFKILFDESGKLIAKMDVPAQGAKDLAVKETKISGDSIFLDVALILGKFDGKFTKDSIIEGNWKQSGMSFPLTLKKSRVVAELKRPQTPTEPFSYQVKDVEYINPKSGFNLAGTLTLPQNAKNCPAVVLISGSGAQDRDETIFDHKPFLVISDYLTKNGIAVLRVDDRGVGGSGGSTKDATSEDFSGDVEAGIFFLKTVSEINPKQIGLIGHSEGGLIAPMVAVNSKDIAFMVLLAGPGLSGDKILLAQTELLLRAMEMPENVIEQNLQITKSTIDILENEPDASKVNVRLQNVLTNGMYQNMNDDQKKAIESKVADINNKWFRYFLTYDPLSTLTKVKCPVLAINGSKDLQVPADENLEAIENALKKGGNKNFKTMKPEGLNHLFQHCKTGSTAEYEQIEETFSTEILEIINIWIWNSALKN